ncbi:Hypothetical protein A7982_04981 [Minicystis rosea]|nr:Hypothetical protein A7982_04981 [Minicystis rosea]
MALQVITQTMSSPNIVFGQTLPFTFDLSGGGAIISYAVALSSFDLRFATDSSHDSEPVGQVAVRLVPNLVGDTVLVTPQLLLSDGNGSAGSESQDVSGRTSTLTASVLAWVSTSVPASQTLQLLNAYGIQSDAPAPVTINSAATYKAFLTGFAASFSDDAVDLNGLSVSASSSVENGTALTLESTTSLQGDSTAPDSFADVGLVSFTSAVSGLALVSATASFNDANEKSGISGTLSATIDIPSGFTKIVAAVPLIESFSASFKNSSTAQIAELAAGVTGGPGFPGGTTFPITESGTQTWSLYFNIWGDRGSNTYIDTAALTAQVLVQFA